MAGKITDSGERAFLTAAIQGIGTLTMHLAKSSFDVADEMVEADLDEADYDGYTSKPLIFDALESGNPGGKAIAVFVDTVFSCTGDTTPNDIFGYWITDEDDNIIFAERFAGSARRMDFSPQQVIIPFKLRFWCPV